LKQIALAQDSGLLSVVDAPMPVASRHGLVVRTAYSLVSSGTELSKVRVGEMPIWEKARARPDQVAKVLDAVKSDGLVATMNKVRERLAAPQPLGYSLAGVVEGVGEGCDEFHVGDRVACGGTSACHAEFVSVPANLTVSVPASVPLRDASYTTVAAIAMHGIRTGEISLGDRVLVIGLGLIGQIASRLCVTAGAHVFGVDPREDRCSLARAHGVEASDTSLDASTAQQVYAWSHGRGADVVLITAGGADNQPLHLAGAAARDRARVVVVGAVGLDVPREPYYHKELTLLISRSYGPGRYDPEFEEKGMTYPIGFVPWTERRNMEEIVTLLGDGRLSYEGLEGVTTPFERAPEGYALLKGDQGAPPIAVVLEYAERPSDEPAAVVSSGTTARARSAASAPTRFTPRPLNISFVGMGNFASATLLPPVRDANGATLCDVVTSTPLKAEAARSRAGFRRALANTQEALSAPDASVIFIATRHDSHARYAEQSLRAGKAVFVEKPLALTAAELTAVIGALEATQGRLMVGFNRRFAPATRWALEHLGANRDGLRFLARINAGPLPHDHWTLDPESGGGRLLGEGCHFLDLATYMAGSRPVQVHAVALDRAEPGRVSQSFHIEIAYENGATAGVEYVAQGDMALPKERFEIHRAGTSVVIDDFRQVEYVRGGKRTVRRWAARDKGHRAEVAEFLEAVRSGGPTPIPEQQSIESTALTLAAARSIREARPLRRDDW
jgi:predicted dehydrogenase/threonine dehydrogenase-like Zn-dependent dehydrogenase